MIACWRTGENLETRKDNGEVSNHYDCAVSVILSYQLILEIVLQGKSML